MIVFNVGKPWRNALRGMALCLLCGMLGACVAKRKTDPTHDFVDPSDAPQAQQVESHGFRLGNLMKSDIDMVAEIHLAQSFQYLEQLAEKLYRRNPRQWREAGHVDLRSAVAPLFADERPSSLAALQHRRSVDALYLAFDEGFAGDRVLALVEGLRGMLMDAYGGKQSFNLVHGFDPQKLYLSARNIEIAVWKLSNDRDAQGRLFLLSNAVETEVANLSFERQFGKLIALQDAMALVIADSSNRRIKNVIQNVASAVFFPI